MKKFIHNNFIKVFAVIIALTLTSFGIFSMNAMQHTNAGINCAEASAHHSHAGCATPQQTENCVDFHFGLLQKFSHGITENLGFKFILSLLALGILFFVSTGSLLSAIRRYAHKLKIRWRQLRNETISIFQDTLGFWLSIIERKEPAYALSAA